MRAHTRSGGGCGSAGSGGTGSVIGGSGASPGISAGMGAGSGGGMSGPFGGSGMLGVTSGAGKGGVGGCGAAGETANVVKALASVSGGAPTRRGRAGSGSGAPQVAPAKDLGAGLTGVVAPEAISSTERPRSFAPSGWKRNTPSAPLKPARLVSVASE